LGTAQRRWSIPFFDTFRLPHTHRINVEALVGQNMAKLRGRQYKKRAATFGTECGATLKVGSGVSHREAADAYVGIHGGSNPAAPTMLGFLCTSSCAGCRCPCRCPIVAVMARANPLNGRSVLLATIRHAFAAAMPEPSVTVGLKEVAKLCRRRAVSRPGHNWHETRDQILLIGIEWNLATDNLDRQSDACLGCLAQFLR
jgi:hypothetical protein